MVLIHIPQQQKINILKQDIILEFSVLKVMLIYFLVIIRKGVSIFDVAGTYEGSQSSAEQILFQCNDSATEESIISEYGSIIQVNNSSPASFGNLSNFEDKKISAISNSVHPMKGLSYRVENDYSGFYFKTPLI